MFGNNISGSALALGGCFFKCFSVFLLKGKIPFFMLSVSSFIALLTFPLLISQLNFLHILVMADVVLVFFRHFSIFSASFSNSNSSHDSQSSILFSNGLRWTFDFDFQEGFRSSWYYHYYFERNIFNGESCSCSFTNLETSSMNFLPAFTESGKKIFLWKYCFFVNGI